jgi:hypothetical protein
MSLPPLQEMLPGFRVQLEKEAGLRDIVQGLKRGYRTAGTKAYIAMQGEQPHKKAIRTAIRLVERAIQP